MALGNVFVAKGNEDAKVQIAGGSEWLDILGIRDIKVDYDVATAERKGDEKTIAFSSNIMAADVTLDDVAFADLSTLAALLGQSISTSGTTPDQISSLKITAGELPYFKLECKSKSVEMKGTGDAVNDVHLVIYKLKISDISKQVKMGDYWSVSLKCKAIPDPDNNNAIAEIKAYETATNIGS